jgi:predicted RNA-binding Zn-ribbon protein involved in translation (DUF1610 family)
MILKQKDPIEPAVETLESLLTAPSLPNATSTKIKKELGALQRGAKGERDCAFLLEGHVKNNPNRVLIHDLRIECDGEVAQFDHLLINRRLEFWILESKNYSTGIKINDLGEFEYWAGNHYMGIPSPIEQVNRQARILKKILRKQKIKIQRLGITLRPSIHTAVLVSPASRVIRPEKEAFNADQVMKADTFFTLYQKRADNFTAGDVIKGLPKLVDKGTIIRFGQQLVEMHTPANMDYAAKFGINCEQASQSEPPSQVVKEPIPSYGTIPSENSTGLVCPRCGASMVHRVSKRGEKAGEAFWGCSAYPKCRKILPLETKPPLTNPIEDLAKEAGENLEDPRTCHQIQPIHVLHNPPRSF